METPHNPPADQAYYPIPSSVTTTVQPIPILGEVPYVPPTPVRRRRIPRRILLPVLLFAATCLTTFWAGSNPTIQIMRHVRHFIVAQRQIR